MALLAETFVQADVACQVLVVRIHLKSFCEKMFNRLSVLQLFIGPHLLAQLVDKLIKAEIHFRLHFVKEKLFPGQDQVVNLFVIKESGT